MATLSLPKDYVKLRLPDGNTISEDLIEAQIARWQTLLAGSFVPAITNPHAEESWTQEQHLFIGDIVTYDLMVSMITKGVMAASSVVSSVSVSVGTGVVKRIQTGPTEVEYFSSSTEQNQSSEAIGNIIKGGGLDEIRTQLCFQASIFRIHISFCEKLKSTNPRFIISR